MSVAILATVFLGFAPSFYLRGSAHPPLPPILIVHGVVFSAWILLFVVQIALVALHRTPVHRRLGVAGGVLAAAMILLGTLVALRSGSGADRGRLAFLAVPLFDMPVFAILVGAGLACRRVPQAHKRFMLLANVGLLSPAIGRMPWPEALRGTFSDFVAPDLFLVPLLLWDLVTLRRPHPATILGAVLLIVSQIVRKALSETDAWLRFATWACSLVT